MWKHITFWLEHSASLCFVWGAQHHGVGIWKPESTGGCSSVFPGLETHKILQTAHTTLSLILYITGQVASPETPCNSIRDSRTGGDGILSRSHCRSFDWEPQPPLLCCNSTTASDSSLFKMPSAPSQQSQSRSSPPLGRSGRSPAAAAAKSEQRQVRGLIDLQSEI